VFAHPGASPAVTAANASLSYGMLRPQVAAVAAELAAAGPLDGAPVVLLIEPGPLFVETLLAVLWAGGLAVPLSPLYTRPELEYIVGNAVPARLLASRTLAARLGEVGGGRPVTPAQDLGADVLRAAVAPQWPAAEAPAIMLYTSGTTGRPKGVRLSHAAVSATTSALEEAWRWRRDDRLLHVLPLHHTHGLIVALLGALWAGAETRFARGGSPFDAAAVWDQLRAATVFMAVPTIYAKLMEAFRAAAPERQARWAEGARQLRLFTSGSASLPASLLEEFRAATGQTILERYGMTEIGMALSNPYDGPRVPGAVGVPLPGVTVDIVGDGGEDLPPGQPGELRVRSPQLFLGYHGDEAATAAAYDGAGRFCTGDTGVCDERGVVRLLGRTSVDIIKSAGYKISALEIEAALREHPAIADVAVIGAPDPAGTWGELVTACVVLRAGATLTLDDLAAFARGSLAPYKLPRALRLLEALPRNAMGKVQKKLLLEAAP
jgi:malonyl-CoA/methylmalonyl-CoA synthetase